MLHERSSISPILASLSGFLLFAATLPGHAATISSCSDMSRKCIIEVARTYLDARTDNSARPLQRLAPDVRRWENGVLTADKAEDIFSQHYITEPGPSATLFPRDLDRVFVDGNNAIFFWKIDTKSAPNGPFVSTVHLIERLQVKAGKAKCGVGPSPCITEIEVVFCTAPHPQEPTKPMPPKPGGHFGCTRAG
ncbi:MAG TPA: hypothetical protein VKZ79_06200 [Alphaproteobacteria bacterium]|nr:hypothetical protein [Alphaproteobacteria bacterium]